MGHWKSVLDLDILDVPCEGVVADPGAWARTLIAHLDLPWDPACERPHWVKRNAQTASHAQVRDPIYSRSVQRSARYRDLLDSLKARLAAAGALDSW